MIRSICARLALPLVLIGAVGCQQPAPKKAVAPAPQGAMPTVTTPPISTPSASKPSVSTPSMVTPSVVTPAPTPMAPASSSTPTTPGATAPAPAPAAATLPEGAATTAPVIIGETGSPVVTPPQPLGPDLSAAQQSIDTSKVSNLPSKVDKTRSYMTDSQPNLPATFEQ